MQTRFGEVVEASLERLVGQCHRLYDAPPLGRLVRAGDTVYGVVQDVATTALDPTRRVIARGADAASEDEIYREHPQLERLLRTDVALAVVGHREGGEVCQYLPPLPPRIHTFLHLCPPEEIRAFMTKFDFLPLLVRVGQPGADDLVAAVLRQASMAFDAPHDFLISGGRALAALLSRDTVRLNAVLRRLPL